MYSVGLKLVIVGLASVVGDVKVEVVDFWMSKSVVETTTPPMIWGQTTCNQGLPCLHRLHCCMPVGMALASLYQLSAILHR